MKILLCGEGAHDVGRKVWNQRRKAHEYEEGWMQPLVRGLVEQEVTFTAVTHKDLILLPRLAHKHRPLPGGHGARSLAAKYRAANDGCDVVVFMADADSPDDVDWEERRTSIEAGLALGPTEPTGISCVPMSMSEAWLLADGEAWTSAAGICPPFVPVNHPEELWGERDDPLGNHPKHTFARACEAAQADDGVAIRSHLAEETNLDLLDVKCPISFGHFSNQLREVSQPKAVS